MNGIFFASLIAFFLSPATLQGSTGMTSSAPGTLSGVPAHAESDLIERIRQAIVDGSVEDLLGIRTELRLRTEAQEAKAESSDHYTLAYINWRICQLLPENEKKERRQLLKQAQRELDSILEADPSDAEAHALRGSVIGERIGGFLGGMFLGPKASKSLKRAFELDPTNPRVALQRGVSYFFTPKAFGGGLDKAGKELERAQELFRLQPPEQPWPNWGSIDVFGWLGQVFVRSGKFEAARALYEEALRFEPNHTWIRLELLRLLEALEAAEG